MLDMATVHVPVLAGELIDLVDPAGGETVVDCTFGAGGHARLFADRIGRKGRLIAIDRDRAAGERFEQFAAEVECDVRLIEDSFAEALERLVDEGIRADVVYMDLGMSSIQLDTRERGFAYAWDAPLDMRMDTRQEMTAARFIAESDERQIKRTLKEFGEERHSAAIAAEIVRTRASAAIETTGQLVGCVERALPAPARFAGGHPAKRTFQAIRIAVNQEMEQIDAGLPTAWRLLDEGGRLAAVSFHSLEDRRVKRFMAARAKGCVCPPDFPVCACGRTPEGELITRRSVAPTPAEITSNPRSKSAHLRVARKLAEQAG